MTFGGWINLILSVGFVTGLLAWCIGRIVTSKPDPAHLARVEPVETDETDRR